MTPNHPLANDSVWAMYYRDGKTLSEIAMAMNCPEDDLSPQLGAPLKYAMDGIAKHCVGLINQRNEIIASHEHELVEQAKVVENMTDLLMTATGQKAAEREKAKVEAAKPFKFARNPKYLQSVGIGLREGLLNAPLAFFRDMRLPLAAVAGATIMVIGGLLGWIAGRFVLVGLGFAGRVTSTVKEKA